MTERGHLRSIQGDAEQFAVAHVEGARFEVTLPRDFPLTEVGGLALNLGLRAAATRVTTIRRNIPIGVVEQTEDQTAMVEPSRGLAVSLEVNILISPPHTPDVVAETGETIAQVVRDFLDNGTGSAG